MKEANEGGKRIYLLLPFSEYGSSNESLLETCSKNLSHQNKSG